MCEMRNAKLVLFSFQFGLHAFKCMNSEHIEVTCIRESQNFIRLRDVDDNLLPIQMENFSMELIDFYLLPNIY